MLLLLIFIHVIINRHYLKCSMHTDGTVIFGRCGVDCSHATTRRSTCSMRVPKVERMFHNRVWRSIYERKISIKLKLISIMTS